MITITKNGNAVLFEFEENSHYLFNGTIEVPLNSLTLVTDESEMFTFKKAATNDIFISARYDDVNMSKSQLIDFYIANMVGGGGSESGVTSGEVQTMIDTSLEDYYDKDEVDAAISGKADSSAVTEAITAAVSGKQDTLIAGSGITISGNVISSEAGNNVIELTQEEYDALVDKDPSAFYIITDATEINISDYYTSAQTQSAITEAISGKADSSAVTQEISAAVSGKADSSSVYTKSEVDTALSGKQDTLIAGDNITISGNVISAEGGGGKAVNAGSNISITTGETADTINCTLQIGRGSGNNAIVVGTGGISNQASGQYSTVIGGSNNSASSNYSLVGGRYSKVSNEFETAFGNANVTNHSSSSMGDSGNTIFSVGNGTNNNIRHNALEIRQDGSILIADLSNGTSYNNRPMIKLQDALGGGSITIDPTLDSGSTNAVANSAITAQFNSIDARLSEDEEVTAAGINAVNDKFDGLRLKKLTQAEYNALTVKDNNTLYILVG